jgi:hypothetical protein
MKRSLRLCGYSCGMALVVSLSYGQCTAKQGPANGIGTCACLGKEVPTQVCVNNGASGSGCNFDYFESCYPGMCATHFAESCNPLVASLKSPGDPLGFNELQLAHLNQTVRTLQTSCIVPSAFEEWAHARIHGERKNLAKLGR